MVPGRRTVHGGTVQDRRVPVSTSAAMNGPSSMADAQAGGRTLLDKLTSKFSKRWAFFDDLLILVIIDYKHGGLKLNEYIVVIRLVYDSHGTCHDTTTLQDRELLGY